MCQPLFPIQERYGAYDDGKLVEVGKCSGVTDEQRGIFAANPDAYLGKVIEIAGQEISSHGRIRFPRFVRFRDDKPVEECLLQELRRTR